MNLNEVDFSEADGNFGDGKASAAVRHERTVAGNGPLLVLGKLLTRFERHKTLAQRLADGEEIERNALAVGNLPLENQLTLSLRSIDQWGCPFCGSLLMVQVSGSVRLESTHET